MENITYYAQPTPTGHLQVKRVTEADGVQQNHRYCLHPGQSLEGQPQEVIDVAIATWTPEVIAVYEASLPPAPTPEELLAQWRQSADCSKRELYLALDETTLPDATNALTTILAWIDHPDTPRAVKIEWETSYRYARRSPLISAFAPTFGLTDVQVDDILKLAQSKAI